MTTVDGDGSRWSTMKSMQRQNVSKTIGENKNLEGRIAAKSEIVEIQLKYVSFWQPQIGMCARPKET